MSEHANSGSARAIVLLVNEVRPKTMQLLQMSPATALLWAPPGTSNHITWHAGHAAWLADVLCVKPITGVSGTSIAQGADAAPRRRRRHPGRRGRSCCSD